MILSQRRLFGHFNWPLAFVTLLLCVIGIINLYSAGLSYDTKGAAPFYLKQCQWIVVGLVFMVAAVATDYRIIVRYAYPLHGLAIAMLLLVSLYGYATRGSQRWIYMGGLCFQPSEVVKITLILALARYFSENYRDDGYKLRELIVPFIMMVIPFVFILHQPDLGTALMLVIIFASVVLFVRIRWKDLLAVTGLGLVGLPALWYLLKDYQKERILTFFNPDRDPLGAGYHIIQSIIAVGSGGMTGKGFLKGTQTQLKFLPEQQTDFVFSVVGEEWGFIGGAIVVGIFIALLRYGFRATLNAKDYPGTLVAFGITMLIFWSVFINIGMVLGLLPVVGIPLPFLSYGGSSIVAFLTAVGLLLNVDVRRFALHG
ncbi:MAG TPA: rod shape-determining protein RodA [Syntrophales bacterium]|nr:rod shape-determining protein RodA [Syntrophales bacterium]HOL58695.1 rod shape-determining protein RodA [Syntrophales bacterium]HPO35017.1 rod shape-determining protein RodA [Syntrophales bacterium]